jgi:hypothetical protein
MTAFMLHSIVADERFTPAVATDAGANQISSTTLRFNDSRNVVTFVVLDHLIRRIRPLQNTVGRIDVRSAYEACRISSHRRRSMTLHPFGPPGARSMFRSET